MWLQQCQPSLYLWLVLNLTAVLVVESSFRPAASSGGWKKALSIDHSDPRRNRMTPPARMEQLLLQASSSSSNKKNISNKNRDNEAPLVEEYRPLNNNNNNNSKNNNNRRVRNDDDADYQKRSQRWVILVDDELSIRRAVGQLLADRGYQVTTCADGATALDVLAQAQTTAASRKLPDAIVSDVRMPRMDGLQFLQELRQSSSLWVDLPVVLLTAKGLPQDRVRGYDAGADAYLAKPFDPDELVAVVDSVVERHERLSGGSGSSSGSSTQMEDLKRDLQDIKFMLLEQGGGGPGRHGFVDKASNVFLAPQERQVLELLCDGLRNKEIAERTYLSTRRVEQLLTTMYRKTNVKNRTELVRWAIATGNVRL